MKKTPCRGGLKNESEESSGVHEIDEGEVSETRTGGKEPVAGRGVRGVRIRAQVCDKSAGRTAGDRRRAGAQARGLPAAIRGGGEGGDQNDLAGSRAALRQAAQRGAGVVVAPLREGARGVGCESQGADLGGQCRHDRPAFGPVPRGARKSWSVRDTTGHIAARERGGKGSGKGSVIHIDIFLKGHLPEIASVRREGARRFPGVPWSFSCARSLRCES